MSRISGILGALLTVALLAQPAAADKVMIFTDFGDVDEPELCSPAMFLDLFLYHENGKVYETNTGPLGITEMEVPPGLIGRCRAYEEGSHVASWSCNIPIGKEALDKVLGAAIKTSERAPALPSGGSRRLFAYNISMLNGNKSQVCDGCAYMWGMPDAALHPSQKKGLALDGAKIAYGAEGEPHVIIRVWNPYHNRLDEYDIGTESEVRRREAIYWHREWLRRRHAYIVSRGRNPEAQVGQATRTQNEWIGMVFTRAAESEPGGGGGGGGGGGE